MLVISDGDLGLPYSKGTRATELMVYKIYFDGFKGLDYSGAAAQSIILMLLVIVLTIAQFRFIERRIHYK